MMSLQVRLSHESLAAPIQLAGERVLPLLIMSLHMTLEVIRAAEELPTSFDLALEIGIFFCCVLAKRSALAL